MHWLLLSILSSSLLMLIFISFKRFQIDTFYAIVVNYFVCILVALNFIKPYSLEDYLTGWLPMAVLLGLFFISLFFLIGITTQKMGASVTSVAMKLGYVIPVFLAFTYYKNESVTISKIIGILLTILAVLFTSFKKDKNSALDLKLMILPFIIFLGSGIADSMVQNVNNLYFTEKGSEMFVFVTFVSAFSAGFLVALFKMIKDKKNFFVKKNIVAGVFLGIPNYFSIYFIFKALAVPYWEDSFVFPVNNIGIVIVSSVLAVIFFKEKLNKFNLIGLGLAVISILVLNLQNLI